MNKPQEPENVLIKSGNPLALAVIIAMATLIGLAFSWQLWGIFIKHFCPCGGIK